MTDAGTPRAARRWRRVLVGILLVATALIGSWWALVFLFQRGILFPRGRTRPVPEARTAMGGQEEWIDTPDGRVEAWLVPARSASPARKAPAVLFFHGNAELIDHAGPVAATYARLGMTVLLPEYPGYGRSAGDPSEEAIVAVAARFLERLLEREDVDPDRLVFHGRSVGAGVACALAARRAPAALVLESAFRSVPAMAKRWLVPSFLVRDPFDNEAVLRGLDRPVLLFHGRRDSIVPFEHSVALEAAAPRATLVAYECDHNDLPPDPAVHEAHLAAFLRASGALE